MLVALGVCDDGEENDTEEAMQNTWRFKRDVDAEVGVLGLVSLSSHLTQTFT